MVLLPAVVIVPPVAEKERTGLEALFPVPPKRFLKLDTEFPSDLIVIIRYQCRH